MTRLKHLVVIAAVPLAVSACATFGQLDDGLSALVGQNEEVAFQVLGYPSGQQQFGDTTVYVWGNSSSGAFIMPTTTNTYGNVGLTPFSGSTYGSTVVPVSYQCTVKVMVSQQKVIKGYDYNGNLGGCSPYIKRVRAYKQARY